MSQNAPSFRDVICIGAATTDRFGETVAPARLHTSNIGRMRASFGGAARNVAENLARLGVPAALVSVVGADADGDAALAATAAAGVDVGGCRRVADAPTASYTAIFDESGELVIGLADMDILSSLEPAIMEGMLVGRTSETLVFADANLQPETLAAIAAKRRGALAIGPVSVQKSRRIAAILPAIDVLFLNVYEAEAILGESGGDADLAVRLAERGVARGVLTAGARGGLAWNGHATLRLPAPRARATNVSGAGDALAAATLARLAAGDDFFAAAEHGMDAAALTVETAATVHQDLSMALLMARAPNRDDRG